jgi:hypothetical protein
MLNVYICSIFSALYIQRLFSKANELIGVTVCKYQQHLTFWAPKCVSTSLPQMSTLFLIFPKLHLLSNVALENFCRSCCRFEKEAKKSSKKFEKSSKKVRKKFENRSKKSSKSKPTKNLNPLMSTASKIKTWTYVCM